MEVITRNCFSLLLKTWLVVTTFSGVCFGVSEQDLSWELREHLFNNYSASLIPTCVPATSVKLSVVVALRQIIDMDEKEQKITSYVWVRMSWEDCRLSWDPASYNNITHITVPYKEVWVPDISLYDSAAEGEMLPGIRDFRADILNTSTVKYLFPAIIKTVCLVNVRYFPFDTQICEIKLGSWSHHGLDLDIISGASDMSKFTENSEWIIEDMPAKRHVEYYNCCPEPYPDITYYINMKRRPDFYLLTLVFPCLLMSLIAAMSFILPVESGEKVSLEVTILLSLAVFMLIVTESMPPSSDNFPLMGIYFAVSMCLVTMSCSQTVIVLNVFYRGNDGQKVPDWAKRNILGRLGRFLGPKKMTENETSKIAPHPEKRQTTIMKLNVDDNAFTSAGEENHLTKDTCTVDYNENNVKNACTLPSPMPKISTNTQSLTCSEEQITMLRNVSKFVESKQIEDDICGEWRDLAFILDRLFLLLYIVLTVMVTILFLLLCAVQ